MQAHVWLLASWGGGGGGRDWSQFVTGKSQLKPVWSTPHAYRAEAPSFLHRGLKNKKQEQDTAAGTVLLELEIYI